MPLCRCTHERTDGERFNIIHEGPKCTKDYKNPDCAEGIVRWISCSEVAGTLVEDEKGIIREVKRRKTSR